MNREWIVRDGIQDDIPFIFTTWIKSYCHGSGVGKSTKSVIFYSYYTKVIDQILLHPETQVRVASWEADDKVIFGYCVASKDILHYSFTKEAFRNKGIARSLYEDLGSPQIYTHKTFSAVPICRRYLNMTFNPFLLYKGVDYGTP